MGTIILPAKVRVEVVEVRLIPVTLRREGVGDRPGWKGYAYAAALTDYCPCCNQPKSPYHATKETFNMSHAALIMEDYIK